MSELASNLSSDTGVSPDLVHQGLGAILDFLRQHVGPEIFDRVQAAVPGASDFIQRFQSAVEGSKGGLFEALAGLAGKLLGGRAQEVTQLLESFTKLGFKPEQIEAFLPRALEFIKSHLPADLIEQILAKLPALAQVMATKAE